MLIISLGCVSASDDLNATDTLALENGNQNTLTLDDNSQDEIVSASKYTGNFKELYQIIDNANDGDTIYLNKDYKGSGVIDILATITIDGRGHTIDASGQSEIFETNLFCTGITLKNIIFKNGYSESTGGALDLYSPAQIINCKFINNKAREGGAVFNRYATTVQGCTFQDNSAELGGGALCGNKFTVKNCVFTNNAASYANSIETSDLELTDSSFTSKSKTEFIYFISNKNGGQLFLENNAMNGANPYYILYEGEDPITSRINLNFLDKTVKKGQSIEIAKITDDKGNPIRMDNFIEAQITDKNAKVVGKFKLNYNNGYKYTCNLNDGTYTVTAKVPSSVATNVNVRKARLTVSSNPVQLKASDVTKYYKGTQTYSVTVTNKGKVVSGASVSITINKKTSTVKTDKNGVAKLALNQASGTYQITSSYSGKQITTKVTIKPTITGKDASGTTQGTKYSVTALQSNGNPLKWGSRTYELSSTTSRTNLPFSLSDRIRNW